jgi:hypothetical protein
MTLMGVKANTCDEGGIERYSVDRGFNSYFIKFFAIYSMMVFFIGCWCGSQRRSGAGPQRKNKETQSQATYRRDVAQMRFQALTEREHGCWEREG